MSSVSSIVVRFTRIGTLPSSTYTFYCASETIVRAVQILDKLMMTHPTRKAVQMMPTSLILFSKFLMTIGYSLLPFNICTYSVCSMGMTASRSSVKRFSNSAENIST